MKSLQLTIFWLGIVVTGFTQTKDQAAIRETIETSIRNFHTNTKVLFGNWQIQPETRWVSINLDSSILFMTAEDFKRVLANNAIPPASNATSTFSNFAVKADGKVGWATFDDKTVYPDGKAIYLHQFRLLEKIDGTWKIISGGSHLYKPQ